MLGTDRYRVGDVACVHAGQPCPVVNLSVGGFFVASDLLPTPGEQVQVDLVLPRTGPVPVTGQVAWVNHRSAPSAAALAPGFGVKLTRLSFDARVAMLRALRDASTSALRRPGA
jgi:Tfp pilus assembly protein PilZ